jgi:hypothetical protein
MDLRTLVLLAILAALVLWAASGSAHASLVGYWTFDEGSANTAYDSSGYGNTGTLYNNPTRTTGVFGGALSFNGVNQYVMCPNSSSLSITGDMTIAAWVRPVAPMAAKSIISKFYNGEYDITFQESRINYYNGPVWNAGNSAWFAYTFSPDQWYHIAVTREAKTMRLYVNGVYTNQALTMANVPDPTTWGLSFGCRPNLTNFMPGTLDDVRIYNNALTLPEIRSLLPEPGTLALLGLSALGLLRRRR